MNELTTEIEDSIINDLEFVLDSAIQEGILKDIPVVSNIVGVYKLGKHISDKHNLRKLKLFIDSVNNGTATAIDKDSYKAKIQEKEQELEYVLLVLEKQLDYDKSELLAKLFIAFIDGRITWEEVKRYSEVINRLLTGDLEVIKERYVTFFNHDVSDAVLRNTGLGLMRKKEDITGMEPDGRGGMMMTIGSIQKLNSGKVEYIITEFAEKLLDVIK